MASSLSYLCGLATMVFITTGLVVAAVRWFHMCRPYDRNPGYYYPGRPYVTGIFLSAVLLLPYALNPESEDAWHLAQMYFLPVALYQFPLMLLAYFGNVMHWRKWQLPILIAGAPVAISLVAATVLAIVPGDHVTIISRTNLLVLGALMTAVCITALYLVLSWAGRFDEDDFSNPADYPVPVAKHWSMLIVINMALCWAGALANNRVLLAVIMLLFSAFSVGLIITALHPHRCRPVEEELQAPQEESASAAPETHHRSIPAKRQQEILEAIRTVVEGQEAYRDAHLTLQDVALRSGYNRSYISGLVKAEWGGFFAYVNRLRLQYVDKWLKEHPAGTIQEAVEESGFSSRQAYYAVKTRLGQ